MPLNIPNRLDWLRQTDHKAPELSIVSWSGWKRWRKNLEKVVDANLAKPVRGVLQFFPIGIITSDIIICSAAIQLTLNVFNSFPYIRKITGSRAIFNPDDEFFCLPRKECLQGSSREMGKGIAHTTHNKNEYKGSFDAIIVPTLTDTSLCELLVFYCQLPPIYRTSCST